MRRSIYVISLMVLFIVTTAFSEKKCSDLQRKPTGVHDVQYNKISNISFPVSNMGFWGLDYSQLGTQYAGSGIWPKNSDNLYVFAAGYWFGAKKIHKPTGENRIYCYMGYDPNRGESNLTPGSIEEGDTASVELINKNRVYFSTDFNLATGEPKDNDYTSNWPLWKTGQKATIQYGKEHHKYEIDESKRNLSHYPAGPSFISQEDIFTISKDTDLKKYKESINYLKEWGYPLQTETEVKYYTFGKGNEMQDAIVICYLLKNKSKDTLKDCWFAKIIDMDIQVRGTGPFGAGNDFSRYFFENPGLNLVCGWTGEDRGESGYDFGYIGMSLIETPAVDDKGFIRQDKLFFERAEQLGLVTAPNWSIVDDVTNADEQYKFMSSGIKGENTGPGDKRVLLASGPFNLRPGDEMRVAIAVNFALPAKQGKADGSFHDLTGVPEELTGQYSAGKNSLIGGLETVYQEYYKKITSIMVDEKISSAKTLTASNPI